MELKGKKVLIVGLGRSGLAAARLCLAQGATVSGTDSRAAGELSAEVRALGIELFSGGHDAAPFHSVDLIIVSPGVPELVELTRAEASGVSVMGELELAARFCSAPILAVGGTNGKSTTTTLLATILEADGRQVFAGGNLGAPLAEAVGKAFDVLVVEVSSFQLERAPTFQPKVSILLNITDDHLDRYADFADYARAKGNAFAQQGPADFAVVPLGDEACLTQARRGQATLVTFGPVGEGNYHIGEAEVVERSTGEVFDLRATELLGRHNWFNAAAAIAAARSVGVSPAATRAGLQRFKALAHRMAIAGTSAGVRYYDDSKGTNVGAAVTAVLGVPEAHVVLVAGGRDKQGSYAPLAEALRQKGRAAVLIGEAAERIAEALSGVVRVEHARTMEEAVRIAGSLAEPGDAVLLSPACSSFDMFTGYAARGDAFAAAVRKLDEGAS